MLLVIPQLVGLVRVPVPSLIQGLHDVPHLTSPGKPEVQREPLGDVDEIDLGIELGVTASTPSSSMTYSNPDARIFPVRGSANKSLE